MQGGNFGRWLLHHLAWEVKRVSVGVQFCENNGVEGIRIKKKGKSFSPTLFTSSTKICPKQTNLQPMRITGLWIWSAFGLPPEVRHQGGRANSTFIYSRGLALNHLLIFTSLQKGPDVGDARDSWRRQHWFGFIHESLLLWAILFSLIPHSLFIACGKEEMIGATSSGPPFRNSFLGVSFHAQGMV